MKETLEELLEGIRNHELNLEITTFWDGGYSLRMGDAVNGFRKDDTYFCGSMEDLKIALKEELDHLTPKQ